MIRLLLVALWLSSPALSDTLRIATFNTELSRDGPGLLLRDIQKGKNPQIDAVVQVITRARPDILALQSIDWDHDSRALSALNDRLIQAGHGFDHLLALQPNTGIETGLDMNGDGYLGDAEDAQSFGAFTGQGGIALLSRYPFALDQLRDLSPLLWRDLPGALLPTHPDGRPFPSDAALAVQRLSYTGHWVVPVALPQGRITLMSFQAAPPVFDGPEDQNGRRNHDEILLWTRLMDGAMGPAPARPMVLLGGANQDPDRGQGRKAAIRALLAHPHLQDPKPRAPDGSLTTVDWGEIGQMRVDYILPDARLTVTDAGIEQAPAASRHHLVWVDLDLPG